MTFEKVLRASFPQILTKDSVTVSVDAVVFFKISDPTMSVSNVARADKSTRLLAQTTLRNFLGTKSLAEILADREEISRAMQVLSCSHIIVKSDIYLSRVLAFKDCFLLTHFLLTRFAVFVLSFATDTEPSFCRTFHKL